jgi:hypothetical protein
MVTTKPFMRQDVAYHSGFRDAFPANIDRFSGFYQGNKLDGYK